MPKLPDYTALGLEQPHPSGHVPHYSPAGFNYLGPRGGQYIGQALNKIGSELEQFGATQQKKADALQQAQADADVTIGLAKLNSDLSKNPDYESWPQQWQEGASAIVGNAQQRFSNQTHAQEFSIRQNQRVALGSVNVGNEVFKRRGEAVLEENRTKDEELYQSALNDPDPASADAKIKEITALHAGAVQAGYADPRKTDMYLRKRAEQFGEDWLKLQPEERRLELLKQRLPGAAPRGGGQSRLSPEDQQRALRTVNAARPDGNWGDPRRPGFESEHLTTIATKDGKEIRVNTYAAPAFQGFLNDLEASGYDIKDIGGYNFRNKRGSNELSQHAFGNALDINPDANPHQRGLKTDLPPNVGEMAAKWGLSWGGNWSGKKDAMHFEYTGIGGGNVQTAAAAPARASQSASQPTRTASLNLPGIGQAEIYGATPDSTQRMQSMLGDKFGFMAPTIKPAPGEAMKGDQPYIELPQGMGRVVIPGATPEQLKGHHDKLAGANVLPGTKLVLPGDKKDAVADKSGAVADKNAAASDAGGDAGSGPAAKPQQPTRTGTPADLIPGHRLPQLLRQAERDLAVANNRKTSENSAENFRLKKAMDDDVARIGAGDHSKADTIDPEKVRLRLGAKVLEEWQDKREMAHEVFKQSSDLSTLPAADIETRLASLIPDPTKPNFKQQEQIHAAVKKRADLVTRLRESDPATSVEDDTAVKRATLAASGEPGNPQRQRDLYDARIGAQERAGVEHPSPITRREAQALAAPLDRILPGQEREAIKKVAEAAQEKYGDYADEAFAYAIRTKRLTADASRIAARVLRSIGNEQQPSRDDINILDGQKELDAAKNAMEGARPDIPGVMRPSSASGFGSFGGGTTAQPKTEEKANYPLPPAKAMNDLRRDPSLADQFDGKYGPGAAKRVLDLGKGN